MKQYTVEEFIEELKKYPNQKAKLNFISNTTCAEDEAFDIDNCEVECMEQDKDYVDSYDIMVHKENELHNEESIIELLDEHGKLTIELDIDNPHSNIVVLNENEEVLREIAVGGRFRQEVNIGLFLKRII
jgi:hypothetical protein